MIISLPSSRTLFISRDGGNNYNIGILWISQSTKNDTSCQKL